jgi:hypothetical protein
MTTKNWSYYYSTEKYIEQPYFLVEQKCGTQGRNTGTEFMHWRSGCGGGQRRYQNVDRMIGEAS